MFERPVVLFDVVGEVVEEQGVGWFFAESTEVVGGGDDALAEDVMPESVDDDPCEEWVVG